MLYCLWVSGHSSLVTSNYHHLYLCLARLFIEKLPKHPEYSKAPATDKTRIKKLLKQAMPRAMELKEKLKEKYEKEKEDLEQVIQQEVSISQGGIFWGVCGFLKWLV